MSADFVVRVLVLITSALLLGIPVLGDEEPSPAPSDPVQTPSVTLEDVEDVEEIEVTEDAYVEEPADEEPVLETDAFTLEISGQQTWGIRIGFGDAQALSAVGLSPWVPVLDQSLRADIKGTALDFLTLEASFNDQLGPGFQHLLLRAERGPWTGELGDFFAGVPELGVYNKKLLGARVTYAGEEFIATGVAARLQGISERITFRGEAASAEREFSYLDPDAPWSPAPYRRSVLGLLHFELRRPYVEGFSEVELVFRTEETLAEFLAAHDLGYLAEPFQAGPSVVLPAGDFVVLQDDGDVMILRAAPEALLRRRVRNAISEFNTREGLTGTERKRYPFVEGSELESEFLEGLRGYSHLEVDEEYYRFGDAERRRYLALGERDVIEETVDVHVRRPGEEEYLPIDDPSLSGFAWKLFPERGILRIDFPRTFFAEGAGLRVKFDYKREGNVFSLGLSVVPNSERVYLNGRQLRRGTDYTIDYEAGVIVMFTALSPEDELRVDFERQRGALGVPTDYERGIFAVTVSVPGSENLEMSVAQAADIGSPRDTTPTMPNIHTVGGLRLSGELGGWDYRLILGGSENRFPPGENARLADPNRINVISQASGVDARYTVLGHQSGLTVYDGERFSHYGPAQGLGGREVRDVVAIPGALLVATESGLTVVELTDTSPFDRVGSWVRLSRQDDVPGDEVRAIAFAGQYDEEERGDDEGDKLVYLVTEESLAWFPARYVEQLFADEREEDEQEKEEWEARALPPGAVSTALLYAEGIVYMGTESGLFAWHDESWQRIGAVGARVHDLEWADGALYVATPRGVRVVRGITGAGWLAPGREVLSLAAREGVLWLAGPDGLLREDDPAPVVIRPLTAVGLVGGEEDALWAGGEADADYRLDLWRIDGEVELFPTDITHIEGRDLASFQDIPVADHTALGLTGRLALTREVGDWHWKVEVDSRGSGYQEIGSARGSESHRATLTMTHDADGWLWEVNARTSWVETTPGAGTLADSHRVGLSLRYQDEGQWQGSARAQWQLTEALGAPQGALVAGLNVSWSPGPTYSLTLSPKLTGDGWLSASRLDSGYGFSVNSSGEAWSGRISLAGDVRAPDWFTSGRLEATTTVKPWTGWTFEASAFRPYRTGGSPGDEGVDLSANWTWSSGALTLTSSWKETLRHRIGGEDWRWERSVSGDARWSALEAGGAEFTPRLRLSWEDTQHEDRVQGRLSGSVRSGDTRWELSTTLTQAYRPAIERTERSLSANVRWEYRGWAGFVPSANWQGSWQLLLHPVYGERVTDRHDLAARLTWTPAEAEWRNELSISYASRDDSLGVTNRLSLPTDWGTLIGEASATWKEGLVEGKASASTDWALGDMWMLKARIGYALKYQVEDTVRHGLHAGVSLTASF